jgi:tripartite ATP-independent transporter DctP family solute receptor
MMRFRYLPFMLILILLLFWSFRDNNVTIELKSENQIILRLADPLNPNYPATKGCMEFARLVEERTHGRIKIRIFDNGELGNESSVIEQVQFGGIDIARVKPILLSEYLKRYNVLFIPYIYRDEEHMWRVLNGKIGIDFSNELLKEKFVMLCWYDVGKCGFYNSKRAIRSTDDFQGLKLGIPKSLLMMDFISSLGAIPVPLESDNNFGEIQNRTIDGAESSLVLYYLMKYYEIAKFYTIDTQSCIPEILVASRVSLMQLTKKEQEIIKNAAMDSVNYVTKELLKKEREALEVLEKSGVTVTSFGKIQNQKMRQKMLSIVQGFAMEETRLFREVQESY